MNSYASANWLSVKPIAMALATLSEISNTDSANLAYHIETADEVTSKFLESHRNNHDLKVDQSCVNEEDNKSVETLLTQGWHQPSRDEESSMVGSSDDDDYDDSVAPFNVVSFKVSDIKFARVQAHALAAEQARGNARRGTKKRELEVAPVEVNTAVEVAPIGKKVTEDKGQSAKRQKKQESNGFSALTKGVPIAAAAPPGCVAPCTRCKFIVYDPLGDHLLYCQKYDDEKTKITESRDERRARHQKRLQERASVKMMRTLEEEESLMASEKLSRELQEGDIRKEDERMASEKLAREMQEEEELIQRQEKERAQEIHDNDIMDIDSQVSETQNEGSQLSSRSKVDRMLLNESFAPILCEKTNSLSQGSETQLEKPDETQLEKPNETQLEKHNETLSFLRD